jgi:hypothetical protein
MLQTCTAYARPTTLRSPAPDRICSLCAHGVPDTQSGALWQLGKRPSRQPLLDISPSNLIEGVDFHPQDTYSTD